MKSGFFLEVQSDLIKTKIKNKDFVRKISRQLQVEMLS